MNIDAISRHFKLDCNAAAQRARSFIGSAGLVAVLASAAMPAVAGKYDVDRAGATDHPLLSRYEGSVLTMAGGENLGKTQIVQVEKGKPVLHTVEGKISNKFYFAPKGRSTLEIYRNYKQALTAAGFDMLLACETEQCEKQNIQRMVMSSVQKAAWAEWDAFVQGMYGSGTEPFFQFLSARKQTPAGPLYVQLSLVPSDPAPPQLGRVRQFIQIIEPTVMEGGKVLVDTKGIQQGLTRDGKVALYGILFDSNKAVIREQSGEQLVQMAEALKAQPAMKVFIVGHTDGQGDFEANLALSQKRAQAVVDALARSGIAASRLTARGVASLAPVSSNTTDEGRARNRRVEMVVR